MLNLLPFAGIILAVIIGEILNPIIPNMIITPILMILIPVYIMYRQLDSQLDKLNASKTDCVEESDLQELLKDSMKQAAEAFSQKIFCEEFVDALVQLRASCIQAKSEDLDTISRLLTRFLYKDNFDRLQEEDFLYIAKWMKTYGYKPYHGQDEFTKLQLYLENILEETV